MSRTVSKLKDGGGIANFQIDDRRRTGKASTKQEALNRQPSRLRSFEGEAHSVW